MSGILDGLMKHLDQNTVTRVSNELGTDKSTASTAVASALPLLLAALARNASTPEGANSLAGALDRDHDGSALNNVGALLDGSKQGAGQAILGHIFGAKQPVATQSLGSVTGLDSNKTSRLLAMLAPLVLSYLGKRKRENNLDAGGLGSMLGQERDKIQSQSGGAMGSLMSMLDRDKDGSVVDDIGGMVGKMFGS